MTTSNASSVSFIFIFRKSIKLLLLALTIISITIIISSCGQATQFELPIQEEDTIVYFENDTIVVESSPIVKETPELAAENSTALLVPHH